MQIDEYHHSAFHDSGHMFVSVAILYFPPDIHGDGVAGWRATCGYARGHGKRAKLFVTKIGERSFILRSRLWQYDQYVLCTLSCRILVSFCWHSACLSVVHLVLCTKRNHSQELTFQVTPEDPDRLG